MADHVALMREAAGEMRRRALAATRGPWVADVSEVYSEVSGGNWVTETLQLDDPLATNANAEYIASCHPGVMLLLADLLEGAATREEEFRLAHVSGCLPEDPLPGDEAALGAALARVYLGRPDA